MASGRLWQAFWIALLLACSGRAASQSSPDAESEDAILDRLRGTLTRASAYVETYEPELGTLIVRESYLQTVRLGGSELRFRRLTADFILVFIEPQRQWLGFRDVIDVDGAPRRDRAKRLERLLPVGRPVDPDRLLRESARFNIGNVFRTVNIPTLALAFLRPTVIGGLAFRIQGESVSDGRRVLEVAFREDARPTLVRTPKQKDVPASGSFWIDPENGRVVKTRLWLTIEQQTAEIVVSYRPDGDLGLWVPASMRELYLGPGFPQTEIECDASYSNFQRATAGTNETYRLPSWREGAR
jgi:hypothetical protein